MSSTYYTVPFIIHLDFTNFHEESLKVTQSYSESLSKAYYYILKLRQTILEVRPSYYDATLLVSLLVVLDPPPLGGGGCIHAINLLGVFVELNQITAFSLPPERASLCGRWAEYFLSYL